jgi:hypothetical protein
MSSAAPTNTRRSSRRFMMVEGRRDGRFERCSS